MPQRSSRPCCAGGVIRPPSLRFLPHLAGTHKAARAARLATGGARVKFLASDESRRPVICVDIRAFICAATAKTSSQLAWSAGCSRRRIRWQFAGDPLPLKPVGDPNVERRRQSLRIVEAASHDVDATAESRISVCQRRAASSTEAAGDRGRRTKLDRRAARNRKLLGAKHHKWKRRGRCGSAARFTMADAARLRLSFDAIAHRPAETSALARNKLCAHTATGCTTRR